ncbi:MAG: twin-arginine translocation signal domain-containing protein [Candidatus Dadabacteria bacterium]
MKRNDQRSTTDRRGFLGTMATGAAALTLGTIASPLQTLAKDRIGNEENDADAWFNKVKGKHRIVFDVTKPNEMMPFAWSRIFLLTNQATGTKESDNGVVVVLRHSGIPYAMSNNMWSKYNFGDMFKVDDQLTGKPATRNPFWQPKDGDFKVPGIGSVNIGINQLQDSGVMFCVCNMALTVYSAATAEKMNLKHEDVLNEWKANILPGIQIVPSGVWAVGRAQEHGCAYCFAG